MASVSEVDLKAAVGRVKAVDFGETPVQEVSTADIARVISEWLTESLKEIDEMEEKDEKGKTKPHLHYNLDFPPTLSSAQRKTLHHHAYTLKLRSTSHGVDEKRFVRLTLQNRGALSEKVLEFVKSDKLEEAMNHRDTGRHSKVPTGMSRITDYLFLGSGKDAQNKDALKEAGISIVLNATSEWRTSHPSDFTHHRIQLADNIKQGLDMAFVEACEIIKNARDANPPAKVLVHCVMGRSRSASIVMAYLVLYENMSLRAAFELTHKARPIVRPNSRFLQDLITWEVKHRGSATFEVNEWVGVVGVHGSQIQSERKKNLPPPIELPPDDIRRITKEALEAYLTTEMYEQIVATHCDNAYESRFIPKFLNGLKKTIEKDQVFIEKMRLSGVSTDVIDKSAPLIAKDWYISRIPKDAPKIKRIKPTATPSATTSDSTASEASGSTNDATSTQ